MRIVFASFLFAMSATAFAETPRIISLGGGITELVCALDACDKIVAVDTSSTFPESLKALPKVGYARNLSVEGIVALKPTMLLLDADAGPPHVIQKLEALKIPITKVNSGSKLEDARVRIKEVAAALGTPDKGEKLLKEFDTKIAKLSSYQNEKVKKRVLFIYARGGKHLMVAGDNTAVSTLLTLMGAQNAIQGIDGFKPLTAEAVAAAKPDVILMTQSGAESIGGRDAVFALPGIKITPAGANKKLFLDSDLELLTIGPRTADVIEAMHTELGLKG
ncbi:MAG: ABC transporter substrate-binding protein [Bdellovibrionota bacterium]